MKALVTGGSGFIGTNLIELLAEKGISVVNYDLAPPLNPAQQPFWITGDIMDVERLGSVLQEVSPDVLIHLAARTDTLSPKIQDYSVNTEGSRNIVECVKRTKSITRLIMTSTQYVYKSSTIPFPSFDDEYKPHTVYGQSKVITEQITRESGLDCTWTIVRPVNIWGPWHMRYPNELWKVIGQGFYVHPGYSPVIRTYGYVKNVAHQICQIAQAPHAEVASKTYYVGDQPIDSYLWLNEISKQLRGRDIKRVPRIILAAPSLIGDALLAIGIKAPLHSVRYHNMVEDFYAPTSTTISLFGAPHSSLAKNVAETLEWIKREQKSLHPYWAGKI